MKKRKLKLKQKVVKDDQYDHVISKMIHLKTNLLNFLKTFIFLLIVMDNIVSSYLCVRHS